MTGKVITVAQQKGGTGKTSLSANLAVCLKNKGKRVAILDTDPQGSLGHWFMARRERLGEDAIDLGFRTASAWGARYEANALAKEYDFVVIDTPPKMGIDGKPAIETADLVVIPVTPSPVDIWATTPTIDMAVSEKKPVLMVLNRASERMRITAETRQALQESGGALAETVLGNRVLYAEVMHEGYTITEKRPSGPGASEMKKLADEVSKAVR